MKKLIILFLFYTPLIALSQQLEKIEIKMFQKAHDLYEAKAYYQAIEAYNLALKPDPENVQGNYELGMSCLKVRDYVQAEKAFLQTIIMVENDSDLRKEYALAWFYYGQTLQYLAKYEEAKKHLLQFMKIKARFEGIREMRRTASNIIGACDFAVEQLSRQYYQDKNVLHLEIDAATSYSEFSPRYVGRNEIIFSSMLKNDLQFKNNSIPDQSIVQLYTGKYDNEKITNIKPFDLVNNNFFHTANGSFSSDEKTFYYTKCGSDRDGKNICSIYRIKKLWGGEWGKPEKLGSKINLNGYTSTQPHFGTARFGRRSFSALYFVSDRPGGRGGLDIWYARVGKDGKLEEPVNCGSMINSQGNEITPYYDEKENLLYFSSDHWYGMGGYDVFISSGYLKSWGRPENIGIPVNSSYDDTYYSFDHKRHKGLLASNRPQGDRLGGISCCEDLYVVENIPTDMLLAEVRDQDSTHLVLPGTSVGFFTDKEKSEDENISWILETDEKGRFDFTYQMKSTYHLMFDKAGYKRQAYLLDTMLNKGDSIITFYLHKKQSDTVKLKPVEPVEVLLAKTNRAFLTEETPEKKIKKGDIFILDDLHFDFNKSDYKDEFEDELANVLQFMKSNPEISIEISGHTDNVGSLEYNNDLSHRRANMVLEYLVENGIVRERMTSKGFGETMPIADNDTDEGRRLNRRTEIKIIETKR